MKKILIIILVNSICYCQEKNDIESIFKMHLFLNKTNIKSKDKEDGVIKNNYLYEVFFEDIILKIDTLKSNVNTHSNSQDNFDFQFFKINIKEIKHNKIHKKYDKYTSLTLGMSNYFILALNQSTGISYRIAGFDTNDFFSFLRDYKALYKKKYGVNFSTSKFLKKFKIEEIDFDCLNEGLKKDEINYYKYPCLKRCNDPIKIG